MNITILLYIGIGGFFGAISRFFISLASHRVFGDFLPFGTLSVNVIGSFLVGVLAIYFEQIINPQYRALFITGFLGSLTTFSAFSLESTLLLHQNQYLKASLYILLNVSLSIGATITAMIMYKKYLLS